MFIVANVAKVFYFYGKNFVFLQLITILKNMAKEYEKAVNTIIKDNASTHFQDITTTRR